MISRQELALSAWALALAAGEPMTNGALGRGISDATGGKAFADSRLSHDYRADYALGYALGRYCLSARVRHESTLGEGKRRLWWHFQTSVEGRTYAASYRFPPAVNVT